MESRLPKPSGLKRPAPVTKNILPMDRIKSNASLLKISNNNSMNSVPLSRDIANLPSFNLKGRPLSPNLPRAPENRAKLRRSRSVCDLRPNNNIRGGSKPVNIPTKASLRLPLTLNGFSTSTTSTINENAFKFNQKAKMRRSRSACDLRMNEVRAPKRQEPTHAPIPSKMARMHTATNMAHRTVVPSMRHKPTVAPNASIKSNNTSSAMSKSKNISNSSSSSSSAGTAAKTTTTNKRIPPYDFKARYNDLLEKHKALKEKYDEMRDNLSSLENLPEQFEESQSQLFAVREELKNAQTEVECLKRQTNSQSIKITSITNCLESTKEDLEKLKEDFEKLFTNHSIIEKEAIHLRSQTSVLTDENSKLIEELTACKNQLFQANMERKELHNAVMDLRGNIRVFCRVRPPLDYEEDRLLCGWNYLDETSLEIHNLEMQASGAKNKVSSHAFSFDHVFHSRSTQEDVFEMVSPLIQSALDGYNICIFAYGQTGSGKTYTMDGIPSNVGVIPRTVDLLFESVKNYKNLGWEYEIKVTFLEIYNEVLYDLLSNEQKDMEIRMSKNNKSDIYVTNITEETVNSASRLRQLMDVAKMNRATAATVGNDRSSRSHAVTKIELIGSHAEKNEISVGSINLVDLAGSESPKTSIRMNETKNINRSLSELTNVILALLQKQDHIPYRNSKLTHLLMPSLGGNSKTLMFINVAPFQDCFVESVKSLRFAATVNSCKMSKAKKNKFLNTSASFG
ncbi:protein claret segregational [Episyrphus balteatus]|uniref:protein claret segregational n=1 Tax=Episyrphus balteatus TaxID=286459 RepID=UPI002486003D|nr:protein claret segregational [Episyrphus balteatus]